MSWLRNDGDLELLTSAWAGYLLLIFRKNQKTTDTELKLIATTEKKWGDWSINYEKWGHHFCVVKRGSVTKRYSNHLSFHLRLTKSRGSSRPNLRLGLNHLSHLKYVIICPQCLVCVLISKFQQFHNLRALLHCLNRNPTCHHHSVPTKQLLEFLRCTH